jgi:hypothetical protein
MAANLRLVDAPPTDEMVTVAATASRKSRGRRPSKELGREREHLTPDEVEKLANAAAVLNASESQPLPRCGFRPEPERVRNVTVRGFLRTLPP